MRVAKTYMDPARFTLVVIGNPSQFMEPLDTLGRKVTPLDLTIPVLTNKPAPENDSTLASGKRILAQAQQAAGGTDALLAAKDYTEHSEMRLEAALGGRVTKQSFEWLSPNYLRETQEMPAGALTAFTDGETGWAAQGRGSMALGGNPLKQLKSDLFRTYLPLLLSDRIPGRKVVAADDASVQISDAAGNFIRADFDEKSHLLHKIIYATFEADGSSPTIVETYSDFRDVNGIKIPFSVSVDRGGRKYGVGVTRDVKLNTGLKAEDLRRRP
jgi:hypothetical protein